MKGRIVLLTGAAEGIGQARVAWHGAGMRLSPKSAPTVIRAAVERVLRDPAFAAAAGRLAAAFPEERSAELAPKALEAVGHAGSTAITVQQPAAASSEV